MVELARPRRYRARSRWAITAPLMFLIYRLLFVYAYPHPAPIFPPPRHVHPHLSYCTSLPAATLWRPPALAYTIPTLFCCSFLCPLQLPSSHAICLHYAHRPQ
ncbi:hypothetical protein FKP32DRAFT_1087211 [Trametes sanguinea]|nr:hypothetical protein FKP32DRAFT_1087211 [Trametes sanguinea]